MENHDFYISVYRLKKDQSNRNRQNLNLSKRILLWCAIFIFAFFFCGILTINFLSRIEFVNEVLSENDQCTIKCYEKNETGECLSHPDGLDNLGVGFVCLVFLMSALVITLILSSCLTIFIFNLIDHKTIFY